ncbi:hypothetical protein RHMOL_Rhmol05G0198200 [Rhododendron molle]|uniref:Uncharacterized protein n=1 Tax=Rhododendron molle TaxID=49168 RepID=A0ACC0NRX3_RHOML|nr:hypothetical protein RHMOL_Rhmol05G0198200 [Rhododendron molle]
MDPSASDLESLRMAGVRGDSWRCSLPFVSPILKCVFTFFIFLLRKPEEDSTTTIIAAATASWQWSSFGAHETLSFRAPGGDVFKTMNSAYDTATELEDPDGGGSDPVEDVISGLQTAERLFFESGETSSNLGELKTTGQVQICPEKEESSSTGGGVLVAMDSMDPYADFKRSMEEIVEIDGLKEWDQGRER